MGGGGPLCNSAAHTRTRTSAGVYANISIAYGLAPNWVCDGMHSWLEARSGSSRSTIFARMEVLRLVVPSPGSMHTCTWAGGRVGAVRGSGRGRGRQRQPYRAEQTLGSSRSVHVKSVKSEQSRAALTSQRKSKLQVLERSLQATKYAHLQRRPGKLRLPWAKQFFDDADCAEQQRVGRLAYEARQQARRLGLLMSFTSLP
jgi:hypothetical protein